MPGQHLHSTLVRFYDLLYIYHKIFFLNLHSTLVRFYENIYNKFYSGVSNLHSTLVRFYAKSGFNRPAWLNLHSTLVRFYGIWFSIYTFNIAIYIPHWLDSMNTACIFFAVNRVIYIPHWLDSMLLCYNFTILLF